MNKLAEKIIKNNEQVSNTNPKKLSWSRYSIADALQETISFINKGTKELAKANNDMILDFFEKYPYILETTNGMGGNEIEHIYGFGDGKEAYQFLERNWINFSNEADEIYIDKITVNKPMFSRLIDNDLKDITAFELEDMFMTTFTSPVKDYALSDEVADAKKDSKIDFVSGDWITMNIESGEKPSKRMSEFYPTLNKQDIEKYELEYDKEILGSKGEPIND